MSQALHTASSGISAGQSSINVIANNVANINTTAFKTANMTFETLYSNTLSYGSAATKDGGGTNPQQVGLGVKIGGITRNFNTGTFVSTGRNLDTMISGTGFYVVQNSGGEQYFTRDGIFSIDSAGNLVTQSGEKVVGAQSVYSKSGSDKTVNIPKNMLINIKGDANLANKTIKSLNNASITEGVVKARIGTTTVDLPVGNGDTLVGTLVSNFNQALTDAGIDTVTFSINNGQISYAGTIDEFVSEGTTSNFLGETGLSTSNNTSGYLNETVTLGDVINYNDQNAATLDSVAIDENGIVVATYNDGSILTQYVDSADTLQWKFNSPEGVSITGSDVTAEGSSIKNSLFTLELATMVNQEGLISLNNNLWKYGPDAGEVYYGIAGEMAFGAIESGGYEESNVDISTELSNMITAQRMIQMNSRVFSTASSIMETLAYLGS